MSQNPNEPKIIVDNDWKAQAQAEREKLAAQEKKAGAGKQGGGEGQPEGMPPADFRGLLELVIMQAITYMGGFPDPETGRAVVSPEHAKYYIDLLGVLEEKTKGNLTAEESSDLTQVLHQLRLQFVELSKAVAQAIAQRATQGGAAGGMGMGGVPPVGPATGAGLGL